MNNKDIRVVETGALPINTAKPLPPGASSIGKAVIMNQNETNNLQNKLANQSGGIKRHKKKLKGGSVPVVVVKGAPSFDTNPTATNANNIKLAELANTSKANAAYDDTVGKNQASVAIISNNNDKLYYGIKGGTKKRKYSCKKGGSVTSWGCLSGGRKSKRCKKCKCKRKKTCKHKYFKSSRV